MSIFVARFVNKNFQNKNKSPELFELRILDSGSKLIPTMLFPKFDQMKNRRDYNHCDIDIQNVERFFQETANAQLIHYGLS